MQAWESQVAELSRQLSRAAADKDDADRERQSLLDNLRCSEQVRLSRSTHHCSLLSDDIIFRFQQHAGFPCSSGYRLRDSAKAPPRGANAGEADALMRGSSAAVVRARDV